MSDAAVVVLTFALLVPCVLGSLALASLTGRIDR